MRLILWSAIWYAYSHLLIQGMNKTLIIRGPKADPCGTLLNMSVKCDEEALMNIVVYDFGVIYVTT